MPDNYKDFNKRANTTSKYIKTPNDDIIYDISIVNNRNIKELQPFKQLFIYGELIKITKTDFDENTYYVDILDCFDIRHRFYITKTILSGIQKPGAYDSNAKYICGGFIFKKKLQSTIMTFSDFYIAKIDSIGLIEITKEK